MPAGERAFFCGLHGNARWFKQLAPNTLFVHCKLLYEMRTV